MKVVYQEDLQTFFGVTDLPHPNVESGAFSAQDFAAAKEPRTSQLLRMQYLTTDPDNRVSNTISLVREPFKVLPLCRCHGGNESCDVGAES